MKKNYMMRAFNIVEYLVITLIVAFVLGLLVTLIQKMEIKIFPSSMKRVLSILISYITNYIKVMSAVTFWAMMIEVFKRIWKDNVYNLYRSIYGTLIFRRFLKQHQSSISADNRLLLLSETHAIDLFNRFVHHAVLDLSERQLKLYMKIPKSVQAQKILKDNEIQIKEEISNLYPEYLISTFERKKHQFWLIGTKRK